jgi:hypothetical protein
MKRLEITIQVVGFDEGASFAGFSDGECLGGYFYHEDWQEGRSAAVRGRESGGGERLTLNCFPEEDGR